MSNQLKLGVLQESPGLRDAVHVAIIAVTADCNLDPGEHVGFMPNGNVSERALKYLGIVDPYLKVAVKRGQSFLMCLYPETISDMRHVWKHPLITNEESEQDKLARFNAEEYAMLCNIVKDPNDDITRSLYADWLTDRGRCKEAEDQRAMTSNVTKSVEWLTSFASGYGMTYDVLIRALDDYASDGRTYGLPYDDGGEDYGQMWVHYRVVAKKPVPANIVSDSIFRCSC